MARPIDLVGHIDNQLAELLEQRNSIAPKIRRLTKAKRALVGGPVSRRSTAGRKQVRKTRGTRGTGPRGVS